MQTSSNPIPDSEYISRDDETEAQRVQELSGLGDAIYYDENEIAYQLDDFIHNPARFNK